jgi:hypothetical protein
VEKAFHKGLFKSNIKGCDSTEPVFIVGMPRTGTTLVERMLASHTRVFAAGELQNFPLQVKRLTETPSADVLDVPTLENSVQLNMVELGQRYLDSTRPRTGHTAHFIDKLPLNFLYLGLIHLALPGAKLICLRRDPMDTCLSNYRQLPLQLRPAGLWSLLSGVRQADAALAERHAWRGARGSIRGPGSRPRAGIARAGGILRAGLGTPVPGISHPAGKRRHTQRHAGAPAHLQ